MSIKVFYFASLKDHVGRSEDDLIVTRLLTVHEVWTHVNSDKALPDNILAAINMEYVEFDNLVSDGDVVAFFPPVTGG